MFRSSPVSSFFLFASSSPSSTPSLSNFAGTTGRNRHDTSSHMKSTLPHKLITIALTINTISLILCVCVIIVVIALTMTLSPSKNTFTYNHTSDNLTSIRQPNFIFTSVYPLISKVSFNTLNITRKSTVANSSAQLYHSKKDAYKSNSLINIKEKVTSDKTVVDKSNLIHHRRRGEPIVPILHPHLPILTTISPEIQAVEQAYGQILAILPLFIISSLLGVSASAKSSTTGAIILYWIILTATLLISTYITSNFVEYENLFTLMPNDNSMRQTARINTATVNTFSHSNDIITDSVDETVTDDDDDFDDIYTDDTQDDKDSSSSVSNTQSQVESVARIIVVIGALQMISAIILTLAKFHKTRVAIKESSLNDLSRFNNPINMTSIDHGGHNMMTTNGMNGRLSSRATMETSLQYYPDDNIDLLNHSAHSSPSLSLHHFNHPSTSAFHSRGTNLQNVTSFTCNNNNGITHTGANDNNIMKSIHHVHHDESDHQVNCHQQHQSMDQSNSFAPTENRFNNLSASNSNNNSRANYFITQQQGASSGMNNFTNYPHVSMYANRVTLPEDILPIESVTCDSNATTNNSQLNIDNNVNLYNCNSSPPVKVNCEAVKVSLTDTRSSWNIDVNTIRKKAK